eukprot:CAMPEP_0181121288 /NCGR_PEP_ID=MMETSP1071-20121207/24655_1 /TAXON_ID=35127 /ORGANISM="Thalassiosira sp., Strain NH16" /LENGTH=368 /DNA_ID=CAMNT_0023206091 /DNA_START=201 /DNA_END=1307 /DNA_ORIENTATION=+
MSTSTSHSTTASTANIIGGDYAGLSATFSPKSGELVPVPEHLVPESMIEWGEVPSYFEVLSSEDWTSNDENDAEELARTTITVLPEVGCGIDNLEVIKKSEHFAQDVSRFESWKQHQQQEREVVSVDRDDQTLDFETIFQVNSEVNDEHGNGRSIRRIRVSFSLDLSKPDEDPAISKLITLQVERQTSPQSTKGTAWSGPSSNSGGLDARTVMNTVGKDIVYGDVFATKKTKGGADQWDLLSADTEECDFACIMNILEGKWIQNLCSSQKGDAVEVHRTKAYYGGDSGPEDKTSSVVALRLPQNIMVRYGSGILSDGNVWAVEVSHFGSIERDGKKQLQRRVVSRSLGSPSRTENLGDVSYWIEEKTL